MNVFMITQLSTFSYGNSKTTEVRFEDVTSQKIPVPVQDVPDDVMEVMASYVDAWRDQKEPESIVVNNG